MARSSFGASTGTGTSGNVLPGLDLSTASFSRQGNDLMVHSDDGRTMIVHGWFAGSHGDMLDLGDGRALPAGMVDSLAAAGTPPHFVQAGRTAAPAQVIGRIDKTTGKVELVHRDGSRETAAAGTQVLMGDVVTTGSDGAVGITLADGGTFSLGKSGRMVLDELVYDPVAHTGSSTMTVVAGAFTMVSGAIAKTAPGAAQVKTPVMTIGIRGTSTAGFIDPSGGRSSLTLLTDPNGTVGELVITNGAGSVVLNQAGLGVKVASFTSAPSAPAPIWSPELERMMADALRAQPQNLAPPPSAPANNNDSQPTPGDSKPPPANLTPLVPTPEPASPAITGAVQQTSAPAVQTASPEPATGNTSRNDTPTTTTTTTTKAATETSNAAPTIGGNTSVNGHGSATGTLSFHDADGDATTFTAGTPSHGTLSWSGNHYTYTRTGNWGNGDSDSFAVTVTDSRGASSTATVNVTMTDAGKSFTRSDNQMLGLTFDGNDGPINLSASGARVFSGADNFTIAMWVCPTGNGGMLYRQQHGGAGQLGIYSEIRSDGSVLFGLDNGGWIWAATPAGSVTMGQWVQLTFVKNGTTITTYLNGAATTATADVSALSSASSATGGVVFGADFGGNLFHGTLGQLAVFNAALGLGDIQAWAKGPQTSANLEELYLMNSADGVTFADTSGNGRDFTVGTTASDPTYHLSGSITVIDPDGDTLTALTSTTPAHGTLAFTPSGTYGSADLVYTPTSATTDSFTVTSTDNHGASTTVTLPTQVTSGNDTFVSTSANELIEGGPGSDTVTFSGATSSYYFAIAGDRLVVGDMRTSGGTGRDILSSIEKLDFTDMDHTVVWNSSHMPTVNLTSSGGTYTFTVNSALVAGGSSIIGGAGADTLRIYDSANLTDSAFSDVSGVEKLALTGGGSVVLGTHSANAGITEVDASGSSAAVTIDTSARIGGITVSGGSGTDHFVLARQELTTITNFHNDRFDLSNTLFGLGNSGTLDLSHFAHASGAPDTTAQSLGMSGIGIMVVAGSGGADLYAVADLSNVTSGNSYQIAHLDNVSATSIEATDFKLVS